MRFKYPDGATPIDPDEALGLMPKHIQLQTELNEYEQNNILEAELWLFGKQQTPVEDILNINFFKKIHKRMFGQVWRWAGQFRTTDKNIGCCWSQVSMQLKSLCDDTLFQVNNHTYEIEETVVRFHHRLVSIHAFPNGNGRHARTAADYLLYVRNGKRLSWGRRTQEGTILLRKRYINALKLADRGDYTTLIEFAKS